LFDRIASNILSQYRDLCLSVQLELIGCKVLAGFVLENTDKQTFTVISLATGIAIHQDEGICWERN
jgi:hypothetical protein